MLRALRRLVRVVLVEALVALVLVRVDGRAFFQGLSHERRQHFFGSEGASDDRGKNFYTGLAHNVQFLYVSDSKGQVNQTVLWSTPNTRNHPTLGET